MGQLQNKLYQFADLIEVNRLDIDAKTGDLDCVWRYKFGIRLKEKEIVFMARNVEERSLWIQSFCRVIDSKNGITPEISGVNSTAYKLLIQKDS